MEASIALKPSLARYEFRPDHEVAGGEAVQAVANAQDADEHLLAVVEHQAQVAAVSLRNGEGRKAITVLRRAFRLAEGHSSPPLPVALLAAAAVRLQLCAALSRLGRHDQALAEARRAKAETDEIWRTMSVASSEAAEADEAGITTRPAVPLRRMIRNPPSWVSKIVEVSIQARQVIALELEYQVVAEGAAVELAGGGGRPASPGGAGATCGEAPPPGAELTAAAQEVEQLHAEAEQLARSLLPEGHEARALAERAGAEARARQEARGRPARRRILVRASTLAVLPVASPTGRELPPPLELPDALPNPRLGKKQRVYTPQGASSRDPLPTLRTTSGPPTASPGDVFVHSLRRAAAQLPASQPVLPGSQGSRGSRGSPAGRGSLRSASTGPPPGSAEKGGRRPRIDPFTEWKDTVQDVGRMTYTQLTVRTHEGQRQVQGDLRLRARRFKTAEIKLLDADALFQDRTIFTPHGMAATEKAQRAKDAWKAKSWHLTESGLRKKEFEDQLFNHYGMSLTRSQPSAKDLQKLYKEAIARSPAELERKSREEQHRMLQEDEERQCREASSRAALAQTFSGFAERRRSLAEVVQKEAQEMGGF